MNTIHTYGELTEKLSWLFLEWRRFLQKRLNGYDITLQQTSLLKQLSRREFLFPNQIADYLHCDRPTASVVIKNLQKKGFVETSKSEDNAKYHRVSISKSGMDYLKTMEETLEPLRLSPFDVLSPEENEQLFFLLKKCCDRTKEIVGIPRKEENNE